MTGLGFACSFSASSAEKEQRSGLRLSEPDTHDRDRSQLRHMGRQRLALVALIGLLGSFTLLVTAAPASPMQEVSLGQGKIGSSSWYAWLEPNAKKAKPEAMCVGLLLSRPETAGSAISEVDECVTVGPQAMFPASESTERKHKQRTISAVIFGPEIHSFRAYLTSGEIVHRSVKRIGTTEAGRLGIDNVGFWVRGFAGTLCIRRVVAYDYSHVTVSDTGRLPC